MVKIVLTALAQCESNRQELPVIVKESAMALRLLGRVTSINVRKALWVLDELGIAYEREDWGLPLRDPRTPEFLALNPNGTVPVLVEDGFVLWESNAIMTYLARRHGSLMPKDGQGGALVEQWLYWQVGELNPQWGYAVNALLRGNPEYQDPGRVADSIERWTAKMAVLESRLERRDYLVGNTISVADIAIALSSHRWFSTPFDRPHLPAVDAHYQRMKARPAGGSWMGETTP
jgi:glutathione S-transferase